MFESLLAKYVATIIISMIPVIELRGAIPIAVGVFQLSYIEAFLLSFIGNIIPVYFILKFIGPLFDFFGRFKFFKKIIDWLTERTTKKIENNEKLQNYTSVGLFLFVGVPLPGTGAWTGSLIANFLKLPIKKAFPLIVLGVFLAGVIMLSGTAIVAGGINVLFG